MFWITGLVMPGLALTILHIVLHRGWSRWASLGVIALVLVIGLFGRAQGRARTEQAVAGIDSRDRSSKPEMIELGYQEASRPLQLALLVDGILAVGVVIGELRRRRARSLQS